MMNGEVEERRRADADVDHLHPDAGEAAEERLVKARAREAAVATEGDAERVAYRASRPLAIIVA